jgi:excisionase family DNA binding protein
MGTMDEALTIDEAAERLKLSPKTVRRLVTSGALPAGRIGRQWRISSHTLDRVLRGELVLGEGRKAAGKRGGRK